MPESTHVLGATLWPSITREARKSSSTVGAVAYVTDADALPFRAGDTLVLDAADDTIASGGTDASTLEKLLSLRVTLYSLPKLHAKVYVFDDSVIIGSSNLSNNSRKLRECALLTRYPETVQEARKFVMSLTKEKASIKIDANFIESAKRISVVPRIAQEEPASETSKANDRVRP